jgi:predicted nucleic acid-binding protein
MSGISYFIDANILVYSVGKPHILKSPCLAIIEDMARRTVTSATNVEVLQEILHIYSRRGERSFGIEMAHNLSTLVTTIYSVTPEDFARALTFQRQYPQLTARDSLHLASLYNNGITHIVSADHHFNNLPGIIRIDPLDWESRQ